MHLPAISATELHSRLSQVLNHWAAIPIRRYRRRNPRGMGMNSALKNGFPPLLNEQSLRSAIESVCAEFGKVAHLRLVLVRQGTQLQCGCFLRLDSEAAEAALEQKLEVMRFATDLHFLADVDPSWTGPAT